MRSSHALRCSGAVFLAMLTLGCSTRQLPAAKPATTILFVGNSFTYGDPAGAAPLAKIYRPHTVTDLNGTGIGGVPALFKAMTEQAGLDYDVSLETIPGAGLDAHYEQKYDTIVKPFDVVLLQSYSTLDAHKPGNPDKLVKYTGLLADAFRARNPNVDIRLVSTWSRADQAYKPDGAWYGAPIERMALDVRRGYDTAARANRLRDVIPVGEAWNRAIAAGVADPNPYDGIAPGQVNLWAPDSYHASVHGYYLEALTIFGNVTGRDPRSLGAAEPVARELGIEPATAGALQRFAAEQLEASRLGARGRLP
ncbi:PEP-CTERM sorting domain-containing protein [Massilia sp. YIM B02763]|uniref:PEP-CTERM sorting domain-containing protein n=1 Tax=Massilia sp. YIM B02763 TaxID=3050130 RepID=UPI0025B6EA1E|nr:PEP-CTERM sorting domain-containing protein [Massilia sp. YIM B02763]MDN4054751.1 PEP-CTERM sorting domain-containing protein [Massilia sp. YIM B02763]